MYSFNFSSLFSLSFKDKRQRVRDASLRDTTCLKWNITWYSWFSGLSDSTLKSWLSSQACGASSGGALFSSVSFWSKWSRWSLYPRRTRQRNTWSEGWQTVTKEQLLITLNIINYYIIYISLRLSKMSTFKKALILETGTSSYFFQLQLNRQYQTRLMKTEYIFILYI